LHLYVYTFRYFDFITTELWKELAMSVATISPRKLYDDMEAGRNVDLIDVRTPAEFREVHIGFARNIPIDRLNPSEVAAERGGSTDPLYVICHAGSRGSKACQKLAAAGYANVVNVDGGTQAWVDTGLPVVRGKRTMSLERQVRIAAGSIVLIGALLGYFVHPYWIALPALVGAGLVFSGITDTCGMGMMLARMPWNQVGTADEAQVDQHCAASPT
jgi:rhodanese-related sulfurtransferase